jgi:hypothetical protein
VAIIDPIEDSTAEEFDQVQESQQEVTQEQVQQVEDDLPAKYKGKTAKEIAQMHIEAEKLIGKHAQEVGEVRRLADELLKRQLDSKKEPAAVEDEIDFFEDPDKAVSKKIDNHPAIQQARQQALEMKQMQTINRLKQDFPDFQSVVADPDFAEWVKASPVRVRLYASANAEFDYDAASELLNTWKYVKPNKPVETMNTDSLQEVTKTQRSAVKAATVDVGSTAGSGPTSKIYRRIDLIRLNLEDPDRYEALQPEIMQAYREGRVR